MPRHGNCKYPPKMANRVFRMVDSGVPVSKAANALQLPYATAYRLLEEEEARQGRKAKRGKLVVSKPGGDMRAAQIRGGKLAQARRGDTTKAQKARWEKAETREEIIARLAVQLRQVTEEHARRERA